MIINTLLNKIAFVDQYNQDIFDCMLVYAELNNETIFRGRGFSSEKCVWNFEVAISHENDLRNKPQELLIKIEKSLFAVDFSIAHTPVESRHRLIIPKDYWLEFCGIKLNRESNVMCFKFKIAYQEYNRVDKKAEIVEKNK